MADRSITVRIGANVQGLMAGLRTAGREVEDTRKRMVQSAKDNRQEWDQAGKALAGFGAVTVGALGASIKAAIDWESAWAGVLKTVDGSEAELAALEVSLRELARTLPASHTEIAAVAEAAGQLGIETKNVAAFTRTMIDLGETTNLSAEEAATGLARFSNVMGTSQTDVDRLGSVIVGLGNNFATTEREILEMGQRLASAGRVVGLAETDVLALATAMSSVGIEAEAGGSAISRVMIAVSKAVDEGGEDLDAFATAAGTSASAFSEQWRTAPVDALMSVVGGLARMTEEGEGTFRMLDELGLRDVRVTNAMLSLSNAVDLTNRAVAQSSDEWEQNTALIEEAAKRYATTEAQIQMARNSINDAAITLGETFLPMIADAAERVADLAEWFAGLPQPVIQATGALAGVAGVASLAAGSFLLIFPRVMDTIEAFKTLNQINPRLASGLGRVGRAAGIAAGAFAGMVALGHGIKAINDAARGVDRTALGVEELTNRLINATEAGEAYNTTLGDLVESGAATASSFGDMASAVEKVANQNVFDRFFGGLGIDADGISDMTERFKGLGETLSVMAQTSLPTAQQRFKAMWDEAGGTAEAGRDLLEIMPAYRDHLYDVANQAGVTADEQGILALATGDVTNETVKAITGQRDLGNQYRITADSLEDQSMALAEVIELQREHAGLTLTEREAQRRFEAAVDDATAALKENGKTLDVSTDKGRANEAALDAIAEAGWDLLESMEANGASQEDLQGVMATTRERFVKTAESMGMSKDAASALADELNLIPENVTSTVTVNTDKAHQMIANLRAQYDGMTLGEMYLDIKARNNFSAAQAAAAARLTGYAARYGTDGYASGGYTGDGGKYEPAGVVHRGEFVFDKATTTAMRPLFEFIHATKRLPGYATGGFVTAAQPAPVYMTAPAPAAPAGPSVSIGQMVTADPREALREMEARMRLAMVGG